MNQHSSWRTSSYSNAEGNCVEASGPWRTSSYSEAGANPNCVEIAVDTGVQVRDTKDRDLGQLAIGGAAWTAFLEGVTA